MPITPPQIDPAQLPVEDPAQPPVRDSEAPPAGQPLTFVPHESNGRTIAVSAPLTSKIRTNRYGELDEHELIKLLDTIEDERARGRFRESIYISVFVWMVIAWVVFYGPKYLWHAPQLISPVDALKHQQMVELNAPILRHPVVHPPPKVDTKTLERLRAAEPKPVLRPTAPPSPEPAPTPQPTPQPAPQPVGPTPNLPSAPAPQPARPAPPIVADAPTPQPTTHPTFTQPGTASDEMRNALRDAARSRGGGSGVSGGGISAPGGAMAGGGLEVLSDMQGVDFSEYLKRLHRDTLRAWIPLLPQETESPLFKKGDTYIILTILPDGTIGNLQPGGSSHDEAIDRAAWNSITSQGKFQPLPSQFHGPNLVLRFHYVVNGDLRER
jgi:outer membrane biosynthesis protein TonB